MLKLCALHSKSPSPVRRHSWSRCLGRVLRETTGERWGMDDMDEGVVCATSRFGDCFLDEEMHGALKPSGQGSWAEGGLERRSWQVCRSSEWLALSLGCRTWKSILVFFFCRV